VFELLLLIFDIHNSLHSFSTVHQFNLHLQVKSCFHASFYQQLLQLLHFFIVKYLWKILQFRQAKRHNQSYHTKAEASSTMRPHFAQKLEEAALSDKTTASSPSSDKRQQQSSTARSQILAEIVFPQSSIFFRRIKSRAYFWKSLVRGRTILKGKVIVVNVHMRNHVCVLNLKSPKRMPTRTSHRTFLLVLFLSLRTFLFTAL